MTVSPIHRSPSTLELHVDDVIPNTRASRAPTRRGRAARQNEHQLVLNTCRPAETASPPGGTWQRTSARRPKAWGLSRYSRGHMGVDD